MSCCDVDVRFFVIRCVFVSCYRFIGIPAFSRLNFQLLLIYLKTLLFINEEKEKLRTWKILVCEREIMGLTKFYILNIKLWFWFTDFWNNKKYTNFEFIDLSICRLSPLSPIIGYRRKGHHAIPIYLLLI